MTTLRPTRLLPWLLCLTCAGSVVAACGGDGSGAGSHATTAGTGAGAGGDGGGMLNLGGNSGTSETLGIDPPSATITIVDRSTPIKQAFSALLDGHRISDNVSWTLSSYAAGDISGAGEFTTTGLVGGKLIVTASYGHKKATAELTVRVKLAEEVRTGPQDPGVSPANKVALAAAPQADPGLSANPPNPTKILYPYDKTVMPRGLTAPLLQFSPGSLPPEDAKVALSSTYFSYEGMIHLANSGQPQFYVPQDIWDAALESAGGETLRIDVTKAVAGAAYGPASSSIVVAPASLKGAVYYMTYQTPMNGLYSVRPGVKQPATRILAGCIVCHSVSANGTRLAVGADGTPGSGIYNVGADGSATMLTGAPPGLGGDSRGISFATFTPDGRYVLRSQNNFWGGPNQSVWRIDDAQKTLVPAKVVGLGNQVSALVPAISADGKHYAFTNGPGESTPFGTVGRSISLMDLAIDPTTDTLTFSNRKLLIDNGPKGSVTKFVNFLPDPNYIVLQEGENYNQGFNEMLPTWGPDSNYDTSTGRLTMVKAATGEHLELANVNAGNAAIDRQRNYEPFPLPVTAGGYFWIVFTSIREYGNTYTGPNVRKQLWVAAISTSPGPGEDPSHPPFYLPNQSDTRNERGFWALEPCRADGATCDTGDECCDGFCRPQDSSDPRSPKVCRPPMSGMCAEDSERCTMDAECCGFGTGSRCIGGFCTPRGPA